MARVERIQKNIPPGKVSSKDFPSEESLKAYIKKADLPSISGEKAAKNIVFNENNKKEIIRIAEKIGLDGKRLSPAVLFAWTLEDKKTRYEAAELLLKIISDSKRK